MSLLHAFLSEGLVERLGWTLVHSLWQLAAVAGVYLLAAGILRRRSPQIRYLAACLALVLMMALPVATYINLGGPEPAAAVVNVSPAPASSTTGVSPVWIPLGDSDPRGRSAEGAADAAPVATRSSALGQVGQRPSSVSTPRSVPRMWRNVAYDAIEASLPWVVIVWMLGFIVLSFRRAATWALIQGLRRQAVAPTDASLDRLVRRLTERLGLKRTVTLLQSQATRVPLVIGWLRPVILMPAGILSGLTTAELEAILLHEMAHIRRHDYLVNLLQTVAETLLFYHPAAWWICRQIRMEREHCADQVAVTACGDRLLYAKALAALEQRCAELPQLAIAATGGSLRGRIEHILGVPQRGVSRAHGWMAGTLASVCLVAVVVGVCSMRIPVLASGQTDGANRPTENQNSPSAESAATTDSPAALSTADQEKEPQRTLRFPPDRSIGTLSIREPGPESWFMGWEKLGEAIGDVAIPVSKEVLLNVSSAACKDLSPLRQLEPNNVRTLHFRGPVDAEGLTNINHLTSLKAASFQSVPMAPLIALAKSMSLEELALYDSAVTDEDVTGLASLQSLKVLALRKTGVTDGGLAQVGRIKSLKFLSVSRGHGKITDEGLAQLKGLTSLERLNLMDAQITNAGVAHLAELPNLEQLVLDRTSIGDDGLAHLAQMRKLKVLGLVGTGVTSEGLAHLKSLDNLQRLNLTDTKVTSDGLTHLASLDSLQWLRLPDSAVFDEKALEQLDRIPALRSSLLLMTAWAGGDVQRIRSLVSRGADVNETDSRKRTPLYYAAWHGRKDVAELLLAHGANINAGDVFNQTPLHLAVDLGVKFVPELLIAKGADIHARDHWGDTPLHWAAQASDVQKDLLELLLTNGADISARNHDGETPLHSAGDWAWVTTKHREVAADVLLANGADVNATDRRGATPLHVAARYNQKEVVAVLLAEGALIDAVTDEGLTPLHEAAARKHKDVVALLIDKGADVNATQRRGWTALHYAAKAGNNGLIDLLLAKGAEVNAKNADGEPAAHLAVLGNHRDTVELLRTNGAEVSSIQLATYTGDLSKVSSFVATGIEANAKDSHGLTPLHAAAGAGQGEVVESLISQGASVDAGMVADGLGKPLHYAAHGGSTEVAERLVANGASVDARNNESATPLHLAAKSGRTDVARLLLARGAEVNVKDQEAETPLHYAAQNGQTGVAAILIANGAELEASNTERRTPLILAAASGQEDVAKLLVDNGADLSSAALLYSAVDGGCRQLVELLIKKGADVNTRAGFASLSQHAIGRMMAKKRHPRILELLLAHGADPNAIDRHGWSLLHDAVESPDTTKLLLDRDADPNVKERVRGQTPLHLAAQGGYDGVVDLLIRHGADVNAANYHGQTALWLARDQGHEEVVQLLRKNGAKE